MMMEEESGGMQLQAKGWHLAEAKRELSNTFSLRAPRTNLASALFHTSTLQSQERNTSVLLSHPLGGTIATALGN